MSLDTPSLMGYLPLAHEHRDRGGTAESPGIRELEDRGHKLLAEAVGAAAVAGSYLEYALTNLLSELIDNPGVDAVTAGLSADQMVQSCRVILRDNPDLPGSTEQPRHWIGRRLPTTSGAA